MTRSVPPRSYVVISPCRNEAAFMRRTLDSVLAQSERPALWVIDLVFHGTENLIMENRKWTDRRIPALGPFWNN